MPNTVGEPPISDLAEDVLRDATELVRAEVSLAVDELKKEATMAMEAAVAWAATGVFAVIALTMLVTAAFLAAGKDWPIAMLGTGAVFVALAIAGASFARRVVPKHVLGRTRDRVANDVQQIKDHAS